MPPELNNGWHLSQPYFIALPLANLVDSTKGLITVVTQL